MIGFRCTAKWKEKGCQDYSLPIYCKNLGNNYMRSAGKRNCDRQKMKKETAVVDRPK